VPPPSQAPNTSSTAALCRRYEAVSPFRFITTIANSRESRRAGVASSALSLAFRVALPLQPLACKRRRMTSVPGVGRWAHAVLSRALA
jgi:hypothetical protein